MKPPTPSPNAPSRWATPLANFGRDLLDLLLPPTCPVTNEPRSTGDPPLGLLPDADLQRLLVIPYCQRCGRDARPETLQGRRCGGCRTEDHWNLAGVVRLGPYAAGLRSLLLGLKYHGQVHHADLIARWLAPRLMQQPWAAEIDVLTPVPMHRLRRWQRPCAHARLLAEALQRQTGLPVRALTQRRRYGPSQAFAGSRAQRFSQVAGAFSVSSRARVEGQTVCLVDNVLTSGATLIEVTKVLRRAGAKRVYACVVARARVGGGSPQLIQQIPSTQEDPWGYPDKFPPPQ